MNKKGQGETSTAILLTIAAIFIVVGFVIGIQMMKPWWATLNGRAELAQAEQNRQIAVLEAQAKMESSVKLAQAEIERAKGVAEANRIIGDSLKGNEDYLRYLYINGITEGEHNREIIYLPTEAGIPILEAGRLDAKTVKS